MQHKFLSVLMIIILTGTALPVYDSVFFDSVRAENADEPATSASIEEITDGAVENITDEAIEDTEQEIPLADTDSTGEKEEKDDHNKNTSLAVTTGTGLVTNPYKGYSYSRLIKEINKLQTQYPELIQTEYIGKTVSGRKIPLIKLGTGNRKILIIGSEHAREYVTTSLIMRSVDTYAQAYALDRKIEGTDVRNVLDKVTFYFVPMVNIDGVQLVLGTASSKDIKTAKKYTSKRHYKIYKNKWKANVRGVDLNRNYPFRWNKTSTLKRRAYMEYRGKKQTSEPEVRSIVKLCSNNQFAFMFTMHTKGQIIYWKDKYNGTVPGASKLSKKVRSITGYRRMPTSGWASCAGESAKWFRAVYNKPAFTIEVTPSHLAYKKAPKYFNKYVWKKNKALFLKTALATSPTDTYKVFLSAGNGKVKKRYVNVKTGKTYGTLPKAKRKGYKFMGWYTKKKGGKKITSDTAVTQMKNSRLYAKYKKN